MRREWRRFGLAALVVLATGSWRPEVADGLAQTLALSRSFVGTVMMPVDDLFYVRGPLLDRAAPVHVGSAVTALVMTGLVIIGLVMRRQGRVLRVAGWVSIGLVAAYGLNAARALLTAG